MPERQTGQRPFDVLMALFRAKVPTEITFVNTKF